MRRKRINDVQRMLDHLLSCGWTRSDIIARTRMNEMRIDGIFSGELVADIEELAGLASLIGKRVPMIEHRGYTPQVPSRLRMKQQGMRWKPRNLSYGDPNWDDGIIWE